MNRVVQRVRRKEKVGKGAVTVQVQLQFLLTDTKTWYQVLGTKDLVPSTWYQVLGTKHSVPSTWYKLQV